MVILPPHITKIGPLLVSPPEASTSDRTKIVPVVVLIIDLSVRNSPLLMLIVPAFVISPP